MAGSGQFGGVEHIKLREERSDERPTSVSNTPVTGSPAAVAAAVVVTAAVVYPKLRRTRPAVPPFRAIAAVALFRRSRVAAIRPAWSPADPDGLERALDQAIKSPSGKAAREAARFGSIRGVASGTEEQFKRVIVVAGSLGAIILANTIMNMTTGHSWIYAGIRTLLHLVRPVG